MRITSRSLQKQGKSQLVGLELQARPRTVSDRPTYFFANSQGAMSAPASLSARSYSARSALDSPFSDPLASIEK